MRKRSDIITKTKEYLECSYLAIFAFALVYSRRRCRRRDANEAFSCWKRTGRVTTELEDFCLDVLSKRLAVTFDPKQIPKQLPRKGHGQRRNR